MSVLLIAGSPSAPSRSSALLEAVAHRLAQRRVGVQRLPVRELEAQALLHGDFGSASARQAVERVARARALVIATPVYKAAYSGVLKAFLDLLPQTALKGKTVLPLATGGSPHHMLALDYALRPVLQALAARHILPGVYATDAQVALAPEGAYQVHPDLAPRLDDAVDALVEGLGPPLPHGFAAVPFAQVRCSV
ncbi:NADPH-dependent FMN reductase [Xylophilus sp. ASV27]|uniref:NADPH-dependent FMN reductase n=1 Tax=Xylophilus sp. ASV27 TaxID=2795129 RepID=UPI0018EBBEE9|nr:NADPH-dependent FMN reductase [Xylophilus sp. ASV27]